MRNLIFTWCEVILKNVNTESQLKLCLGFFLAQVLLMSDFLCVTRRLWGEVVTSGQELAAATISQRQK